MNPVGHFRSHAVFEVHTRQARHGHVDDVCKRVFHFDSAEPKRARNPHERRILLPPTSLQVVAAAFQKGRHLGLDFVKAAPGTPVMAHRSKRRVKHIPTLVPVDGRVVHFVHGHNQRGDAYHQKRKKKTPANAINNQPLLTTRA